MCKSFTQKGIPHFHEDVNEIEITSDSATLVLPFTMTRQQHLSCHFSCLILCARTLWCAYQIFLWYSLSQLLHVIACRLLVSILRRSQTKRDRLSSSLFSFFYWLSDPVYWSAASENKDVTDDDDTTSIVSTSLDFVTYRIVTFLLRCIFVRQRYRLFELFSFNKTTLLIKCRVEDNELMILSNISSNHIFFVFIPRVIVSRSRVISYDVHRGYRSTSCIWSTVRYATRSSRL